jgi:hypothetical protein
MPRNPDFNAANATTKAGTGPNSRAFGHATRGDTASDTDDLEHSQDKGDPEGDTDSQYVEHTHPDLP